MIKTVCGKLDEVVPVCTGCYMSHDAIGQKHTDCAAMYAKMACRWPSSTRPGKVYMPVATDHKSQNAKLLPFVEKKVKLTGTLLEKGGLAGLTIKTIDPAQ